MARFTENWDTQALRIFADRCVVERRMKALIALSAEYTSSAHFREVEAYRKVLRDSGFRWCEASANLRTLWMEGLLSRRYSGRGNVHYYRVAPGALEALQCDISERAGVFGSGYQI
jgi:hypothetical protein